MIRVLVILAAFAALVLPTPQYIDDALGTGARQFGAGVALAAPGVATDKPKRKPPVLGVVHGDRVVVGEDGNGVQSARFATPAGGRDVRYVLLIENGCANTEPTDPARPCPAPVRGLTVTLNDDVVFENDDDFRHARREVALNPADNTLVLAAKGDPRSAARVRILALRVAPPDEA